MNSFLRCLVVVSLLSSFILEPRLAAASLNGRMPTLLATGITKTSLYRAYRSFMHPIKEGLHFLVGQWQEMDPEPYADHVDAYSDSREKTIRFIAADPVGCLAIGLVFAFLPTITAFLGV